MIKINHHQIQRFAEFLQGQHEIKPFNFCSSVEDARFPPPATQGILALFFFCVAHQFGFWRLKNGRYFRPMISTIDGVDYKGSDYLFCCVTRAWKMRNDFFSTTSLSSLKRDEWNAVFSDDFGENPLPMWEEHFDIITRYIQWFEKNETTPEELLVRANHAKNPLTTFLKLAGKVPGYSEDPLQKKLQLLAIILENRPEKFLNVSDPEAHKPIIDYHLQRSALRTGLVEMNDPFLHLKLSQREAVSTSAEKEIRQATYEAIQALVNVSGLSVAAIDYFFFTNRTRCPEIEPPDCKTCPVNQICAQQVKLFQPVFRTTAY